MGTTTFGGNVRSYGGGNRADLIVPGSAQLVVPFVVTDITSSDTPSYAAPLVKISSTNAARVLLPKNTVFDMLQLNQAGGDATVFNMGVVGVGGTDEPLDADDLIASGVGNEGFVTYMGGGSFGQGDADIGNLEGDRLAGTELQEDCAVTFSTAGVAAGAISGLIYYHILDTAKSGEALPELE